MSAPVVISASPANNATGIVLGTPVVVAFDQLMDTTSITEATFTLTGPGQTSIIGPGNLIASNPTASSGREYIKGTFSFTVDGQGRTVMTFTPKYPLQPNIVYTLLMIGVAAGVDAAIKNPAGQPLANNYQWTFTTGDLNTTTPPATSPLPQISIPMDPSGIRITSQVYTVGNNLAQEIVITFPGPIDTDTVTADQILLSLEPILNDPSVQVPPGLTRTVVISGSTITITLAGWPAS